MSPRCVKAAVAVLYALSAAPTIAQQPAQPETTPSEIHWLKDAAGCKLANPTPKPKEAVIWSGACVGGYMDGKGVLQFTSEGKPGARYEGTLSKGHLTGRGALHMADGTSYDGDWVNGKQDGYGKYKAADGSTFEGGWTAGQPDGPGVYRAANGEVVHGLWENGKLKLRYPQRFTDK